MKFRTDQSYDNDVNEYTTKEIIKSLSKRHYKEVGDVQKLESNEEVKTNIIDITNKIIDNINSLDSLIFRRPLKGTNVEVNVLLNVNTAVDFNTKLTKLKSLVEDLEFELNKLLTSNTTFTSSEILLIKENFKKIDKSLEILYNKTINIDRNITKINVEYDNIINKITEIYDKFNGLSTIIDDIEEKKNVVMTGTGIYNIHYYYPNQYI